MKATITILPTELENIIRKHIANVEGIVSIQSVLPVLEYDRQDETSRFNGMAIEVTLRERN